MKQYAGGCCMLFMMSVLQGQPLFYNNGARFFMNPGSLMIVKNSSVENHSGRIDNAGNLIIEGDFVNDDLATGNVSASGVYELFGDWINNHIFQADQSTVLLSGGNQLITGTQKTVFHNLFLTGAGIKTQTIDVEVAGILDLRSAELATGPYEMLVSNTNPGAILRVNGFVSSEGVGRLSRHTAADVAYLFPTGSSTGTFRYRPVEIVPASSAPNTYGVRLANVNPTSEGFDRDRKDDSLCVVNPQFYHRIYHPVGNDASIVQFFYDITADGLWTSVAHWSGATEWKAANPISSGSAVGWATLAVADWTNFDSPAFALATPSVKVQAFRDTTITVGQSVPLTAVVNQTANTFRWTPAYGLSCSDCPDPVATPEQTTLYQIIINENETCSAVDSVLIRVIQQLNLFLPNAFTPNGDGVNDFIKIYGNTELIYSLHWLIFDRWGEKVFEASDLAQALVGWDGTYHGRLLDPGVFTYHLKVTYKNGIADPVEKKGSLTLIR